MLYHGLEESVFKLTAEMIKFLLKIVGLFIEVMTNNEAVTDFELEK